MKAEYHKQDKAYRVMQRGSLFYAQHDDGSKSSPEHDPWQDIGTPKDTLEAARAVMYGLKPEVRA